MKTIEVTMKKTLRVAHEFKVTDDVYRDIYLTGRIPDDMFHYIEEVLDDTAGDVEYDYAVASMDNPDVNIIDWEG